MEFSTTSESQASAAILEYTPECVRQSTFTDLSDRELSDVISENELVGVDETDKRKKK